MRHRFLGERGNGEKQSRYNCTKAGEAGAANDFLVKHARVLIGSKCPDKIKLPECHDIQDIDVARGRCGLALSDTGKRNVTVVPRSISLAIVTEPPCSIRD